MQPQREPPIRCYMTSTWTVVVARLCMINSQTARGRASYHVTISVTISMTANTAQCTALFLGERCHADSKNIKGSQATASRPARPPDQPTTLLVSISILANITVQCLTRTPLRTPVSTQDGSKRYRPIA